MSVTVERSTLLGAVEAPPSKSMTHRSLIIAALAEGRSVLEKPLVCDDTVATASCLRVLGAKIDEENGDWYVEGGELHSHSTIINCNQSGTTLRLLLGTCSLLEGKSVVTGAPQLLRRPNKPLLEGLSQLGVQVDSNEGYPPVTVRGKMRGGNTKVRGDVSSQFISSIILAAPYAETPVSIEVTNRMESKPYVQMTLDAMRKANIRAKVNSDLTEIQVPLGKYTPIRTRIEGDWSSAAFLLSAGALSGKVHVDNLKMDSSQADKEILHVLDLMGADIRINGNRVTARKSILNGLEIDLSDCPDIFPITASLCATAQGMSTLTGLHRLRIKESDRLEAMTEGLRRMGGGIHVEGDSCIIEGGTLRGTRIDPREDHRIAMSFAVLGTIADGETVITDSGCVTKSYPWFWDDMKELGAKLRETN